MLLLIYFILLFIFRKKIGVLSILLLLQITSLAVMLYVRNELAIDSFWRFLNLLYTLVLLTIIFYPWKRYFKIQTIYAINEYKVKRVTNFLFFISFLTFIVLLITAIYILLYIKDINAYKYLGENNDFLYTKLPISVRWYMIASLTYTISYFFIPLHFYYLKKLNTRYAIICLLLSLNIILFGLSFFSRWTITHYVLIFGVFLFLFRDSLSKRYKKSLKIIFTFIGIILVYYFIKFTTGRFEEDVFYSSNIPLNSPIQDPTLYSILDYISQWYSNSFIVLDRYNFQTMKGQASFSPLLGFLDRFTPFNWNLDKYNKLRISLLGYDHYYTFNGLVANWIYDFGYIISLLIALLYNRIVYRLSPVDGQISITNILLLVLLIQIPLFAIFYNFIGGIIFPLLFWLPIYWYLGKYSLTK